jgi:hypothetical protein
MLSNDERSILNSAIWHADKATEKLLDARAKGATASAEQSVSAAQDEIATARKQINRVLSGQSQA